MRIELTAVEREGIRKREELRTAQRQFRHQIAPLASQPITGNTKAERKVARARRKAARTELYLSRGR